MAELTMVAALNAALRDALAGDPRTLVFGEDVGELGGVFRVTEGLQSEFGRERVFNTPIAEAGIAGSVGLAMAGWRPIAEMQFEGFSYPALDQVISHLAKYRERTRGRVGVPAVIRIPSFGGIKGKEHHGESPETYYVHTAGLKVVVPSSPLDAYRLLRLDRRPGPRGLPGAQEPLLVEGDRRADLGRPRDRASPDGPRRRFLRRDRVRRDGHSMPRGRGGPVRRRYRGCPGPAVAGAARRRGDRRGRSSDRARGRRARGPLTLGMGAEIVARIVEEAFDQLEAPVARVTGPDVPYPPASLEHRYLPSVERISTAVRKVVSY